MVAAAAAAAAAAAQGAVGASAKGDLRTLFSADDYPASAQSSGAEGTAQAPLTIGPDGRVTGCNLIHVDRQRLARFGDLQHPSPPRQVRAGSRQ